MSLSSTAHRTGCKVIPGCVCPSASLYHGVLLPARSPVAWRAPVRSRVASCAPAGSPCARLSVRLFGVGTCGVLSSVPLFGRVPAERRPFCILGEIPAAYGDNSNLS